MSKRKLFECLIIFRSLMQAASVLRAPVLTTTLCMAAFSLPPQTIELYRVIVQDLVFNVRSHCRSILWWAWTDECSALQLAREPLFSVMGLAILVGSLWLVTKRLGETSPKGRQTAASRRALAAAPLVLPGLVILAMAIGVFRAIPSSAISLQPLAQHRLLALFPTETINSSAIAFMQNTIARFTFYTWEMGWLSAILICIACVLIGFGTFTSRSRCHSAPLYLKGGSFYLLPRPWLWTWGLAAFGVFVFWLMPSRIGGLLGTLTVFSFFATILLLCTSLIGRLGDRLKLPLMLFAILWVALLSLSGLNNNHGVRTIGGDTTTRPAEPLIAEQFKGWLAARKDAYRYKQSSTREKAAPYPVYVVAAEGGGIYAAYHTARFLAALQDRCPAFAHHLFAVSGVSGGSVGAAIFSSLKRASSASWPIKHEGAASNPEGNDKACKEGLMGDILAQGGSLAEAVDKLFDSDLLSPLLGSMLFPDFAQRFLPFPVPGFDRTRALEYALENAVSSTLTERSRRTVTGSEVWKGAANHMRAAYIGHWQPDGNAPALIFNATSVGTGERKAITPFAFGSRGEQLVAVNGGSTTIDRLPLSTAAVISARFPWFTPSARISDAFSESGELRLVDGGYYDNSGIATAVELKEALEKAATAAGLRDSISVKLIVLTAKLKSRPLSRILHESMDPIRAFFGAWQRRARQNVDHTSERLRPSQGDAEDVRLINLQETIYAFPLGWRLSYGTRYLMNIADPIPGLCARKREFEPLQLDADCTLDKIISELR